MTQQCERCRRPLTRRRLKSTTSKVLRVHGPSTLPLIEPGGFDVVSFLSQLDVRHGQRVDVPPLVGVIRFIRVLLFVGVESFGDTSGLFVLRTFGGTLGVLFFELFVGLELRVFVRGGVDASHDERELEF